MSYENTFGTYEPRLVLKHFYEISQIPRGSGNMERISHTILQWAQNLGLEAELDAVNNVFVRKPASRGREQHPAVALQAHMDMVCEKTDGSTHDFTKDPLHLLFTDGEVIRAKDTTLGGDDGIGVAMIMAILEDTTLAHPPLEAIFTVDEETDMKGAQNFDCQKLTAKKLINLDIGAIAVAGNGETEFRMHIPRLQTPVKAGSRQLSLKVCGLQGGHSGAKAIEERGNAITLLNWLLLKLARFTSYQLISFQGGAGNSSSFARTAEAVIAVSPENESFISQLCEEQLKNYKLELEDRDPDVQISLAPAGSPEAYALSEKTADTLRTLLLLLPDGLVSLNKKWPGLIETTANVGVVETRQEELYVTMLARSFLEHRRHLLIDKAKRLCSLLQIHGQVDHDIAHWDYRIQDEFLTLVKKEYPEFSIRIGQGTCELGVFTDKKEDLEVVALSCPHYKEHSPEEYMLRSDVVSSYNSLLRLLSQL